jgi:hypothetical protein
LVASLFSGHLNHPGHRIDADGNLVSSGILLVGHHSGERPCVTSQIEDPVCFMKFQQQSNVAIIVHLFAE